MPDNRLSVAFDMTFPDRNRAGSGTYARSLVAALAARDDIQTVTVSAPPGVSMVGTLSWLLRGAAARLKANPTSLLHCPTFVTPWNLPIPFVTTVLDLSTRRFPQDYPLEWRVYERWFVPGRARSATLVIAISEVTRRDVIAEYGVHPDRVLTIHPGIDQIFFDAAPAPSARVSPTSSSQAPRSPARTWSSYLSASRTRSQARRPPPPSSTSAARPSSHLQISSP